MVTTPTNEDFSTSKKRTATTAAAAAFSIEDLAFATDFGTNPLISEDLSLEDAQAMLINGLSATGLSKTAIANMTGISSGTIDRLSGGISLNPGDLSMITDAGYNLDPELALRIAQTDNAGNGYCAKGVGNILESMGLRNGVDFQRGNGHDWDTMLEEKGWVRLNVSPEDAPNGAILVYDSDIQAGKVNRGTGGGSYGHAEIKIETNDGRTFYVSDAARANAGGTVADNYKGAYITHEAYAAMLAERDAEKVAAAEVETETPGKSPETTNFNEAAAKVIDDAKAVAEAEVPANDELPRTLKTADMAPA